MIKVNGWLQYSAHGLRPFDSCEPEEVLLHVKYPNMDVDTFVKSMEMVKKRIEKVIAKGISDTFVSMIDG